MVAVGTAVDTVGTGQGGEEAYEKGDEQHWTSVTVREDDEWKGDTPRKEEDPANTLHFFGNTN